MVNTPPPSADEMRKVIERQRRVITLLKDQIGNIVLANVEQAAHMEDMRDELDALKRAADESVADEPADHLEG